jgi:hypothetical protein
MTAVEMPSWFQPLALPIQLATWLVAAVTPFIVPPPLAWADAPSNDVWMPLLHLILLFPIAAVLLLCARRRATGAANRWLLLSWLSLIAAIAFHVMYLIAHSQWACAYARLPSGAMTYTIIGSEFLPSAPVEAVEALRSGDCTNVVRNVAGMTDRIWPRAELLRRQLMLALAFTLSVGGFALALVMLVEALRKLPGAKRKSRS